MMNLTDITLSERSKMQIVYTAWFYWYQDQEQRKLTMVIEVRIMLTIWEDTDEDEAVGSSKC